MEAFPYFFFCFLARLPISPKLLACSLAPLKYLPVLPSSLKINSHSPNIPKTPGGTYVSTYAILSISSEFNWICITYGRNLVLYGGECASQTIYLFCSQSSFPEKICFTYVYFCQYIAWLAAHTGHYSVPCQLQFDTM